MKKTKYFLTGVVLTGLLAAGIFMIQKSRPPVVFSNIETGTDLKSKGPLEAPVRIVEYSDFQCPACRMAEPAITKIMTDYPGKVYFVFRHFPLAGHRWSAISHQAAECANREGKFWPYHDRVYEQQAQWSVLPNPSEAFLSYAKEMGISIDSFATCMANEKVRADIMEEKQKGEALKVESTPTFFVNGERVVGAVELQKKGTELIRKALGLPELAPAELPQVPPADSQAALPQQL